MIAIQKSFSGGQDQLTVDTQIADDAYVWLVNARTRFGVVSPCRKHVKLSSPAGIKQGCKGIGNILIVFIAGKAYYQTDGVSAWTQIPSFQMSVDATNIWSESVPISTFSYVRKLNSDGNIKSPISVTTDFKVNGTPAGIVCQDGISQPRIILYDSVNNIFTSRLCKNYDEWQNVSDDAIDREYVPIGRQMMYKDGKLYIVAPDKKSVYHSITGRPLDFMINVDENGNKLPSELNGGVTSVSIAFDFDDITCIQAIDQQDSFVYGTARNTRIITMDWNDTLFGEPRAKVSALIKVGIVNQYSFGDALNDFVCIEQSGVKSFNAVQQLKFKGNNSIFSLQLSRLLYDHNNQRPIKQRYCSITSYDNYLLFNLDTYWGNLIAVYDLVRGKWSALDITKVARVKQFASTETSSQIKLYCITELNEVYQMFASPFAEVAQLRVRNFVTDNTDIEHKNMFVRCMFEGGTYDGIVELIEYVDEQESTANRSQKDLKCILGGVAYPVMPPIIASTEQRTENTSFPLTSGLSGKRVTFVLQWTNDANLIEYQIKTSEEQNMNSFRDQNLTHKSTYGS